MDLLPNTQTKFSYNSSFQHFLSILEGGFGDVGTADDAGQFPFSATSGLSENDSTILSCTRLFSHDP
jgi:hypothetical protein